MAVKPGGFILLFMFLGLSKLITEYDSFDVLPFYRDSFYDLICQNIS